MELSTTADSSAPATAADVVDLVRAQGVQYIFAQFVDMHGKPNAKLVPASHIEDLLDDGAGFAGFAAGDIGQRPNDPDIIAMPDPSSYTRLPWRPEIARLACDVTVHGKPWPYCPRTILRNQIAAAAAQGYELKVGAELEYFLLRREADGSLVIADELDTQGQPCYDMRALTRSLDFVTQVADHLDVLGWDNYATDHEDANGQFEQNFGYADALTTCDRAIFFRYMVESLAQERGLIATFMPKPFAALTGNGCHLHVSLWKDGRNVFGTEEDDRHGLGLSPAGYNFVAGLKNHAAAYIALTAPSVNSYKRLVVGSQSGSAWAPIYISYGSNNRTQMLRIPDAGRIEDRTVDGSCNPYLAVTAVLACGLDGIERGLDPGEPTSDLNLHELSDAECDALGVGMLPDNLLDATRNLERDDVLRAALGTCANEDYIDYFVRIKRAEWSRAQSEITSWELERYLQLF
ncbi:MAG: type III glutamate--ammonia ligase [Actinobacteria bacterium]|nr:type III glutamate--ammonia ligase [Actinomycetota bacterium]